MQRTLASSAIALIVAAGPSFAELTPAQVWEDYSDYLTSMGYEVTVGSQDESDGTLTLTDVGLSANIEQPAGEGEATSASVFTGNIPTLKFEQLDADKVRTVMEGEMVMKSVTEIPDAEPVEFEMTMAAPDNETISSGSVEDMLHEFNMPSLVTKAYFGDALPGAAEGEPPLTLTITESTGQYRTVKGENTELTYDMVSKAMDVALNMSEPDAPDGTEGTGKFAGQFKIDGLNFTGTTTLPGDVENMAERLDLALNAGFVADGKVELGAMTGDLSLEGLSDPSAPQDGTGTFTNEPGELTVSMSKDGLKYGGSSGGGNVEANIEGLPFPITYAIDGAAFDLAFPVSKSEESQPFALKYAIEGLTLGDGIWDMFDPSKQLSRDPANLTIDVAGDATVTNDLFDPEFGQQMAAQSAIDPETGMAAADPETGVAPAPDMPFMPESLKINEFVLQAVGVDANVTGDLAFTDMSQPPVGQIDGDFKGINALLDKLVAMGIIPEEQIMGPRMMLAMFAKPVDGDADHLETKLEFKDDGSILANGQRVK